MIIGFVWGGWVTGGTSEKAAGTAAQTAVVQAFVPFCVAKAEQQPDQLIALKKESSSYSRSEMVFKAGWVDSVAEKYRRDVAEQCAVAIVEAMNAAAGRQTRGSPRTRVSGRTLPGSPSAALNALNKGSTTDGQTKVIRPAQKRGRVSAATQRPPAFAPVREAGEPVRWKDKKGAYHRDML